MMRMCALFAVGLISLLPPTVSATPPASSVRASKTPSAPGLSAASAHDRALLAHHWAPVHHQAVDRRGSNGLAGHADYFTRVDFDGDYDAQNDWENAARFPLPGAAYQSVVETSSHWFIAYMFFHPRDWAASLLDTEHENDSEGVLLAIARDGSQFGTLKAAVTVAHSDFFSFVPKASNWSAANESIDGVLEVETHGGIRPVTTQEAQGHAFRAWKADASTDGIVYYPARGAACLPPEPGARVAPYVVLDLFEPRGLWDRREDRELFASFGSFAGDRAGGCGSGSILCTSDAANPPWGWDDSDDGKVRRGDIAMDPVKLVSHYFRIPEPLSRAYTHNPYLERGRPETTAKPVAVRQLTDKM